DLFAMYAHALGSVDERAPQRPLRLVTDYHQARLVTPQVVLEVMEYAPARRHARRSDDHGAALHVVELLGSLGVGGERQGGRVEGVAACFEDTRNLVAQFAYALLVELGDAGRHRRIEVDGEVRHGALFDETVE